MVSEREAELQHLKDEKEKIRNDMARTRKENQREIDKLLWVLAFYLLFYKNFYSQLTFDIDTIL